MIIHNYFLCNKDKEPERYQSLIKQINDIGLTNYSFFTYIWGNEITAELRSQWVKTDTTMRYHGRNMKDKPLSNGEISLFLNHIECLRSIRASYTCGLFSIFESDALFYPSYSKNLERVLELAKDKDDIDIINIGSGNGIDKPKSEPIKNVLSLYKEKINRGTDAIIWTYKGICNFLDYFDKTLDIDGPIDTKMDVYSEYMNRFNIHWAHPPLVYQGSISGKFKQSIR